MRGTIAGLETPAPLGPSLPAVYQEHDAFTMALSSALDVVIAPIFSSLDNLPSYFDATLAPDDFVEWLATWIAVDFDEGWDTDRRRVALSRGVDLHARRGTGAGLRDQVALFTGGTVEILENGASGWSSDPRAPLPGSADPALVVRVRVEDPDSIDRARLDALVSGAKPAHVPHAIEVLRPNARKSAETSPGGSGSAESRPGTPTHPAVSGDSAGSAATDEPVARSPHIEDGMDKGTDGGPP